MKTPTPIDDPRTRILRAATEIFATRGFAGARVDEIAARAEVNKATVYYQIGDKDELYAQVLSAVFDRVLESIQSQTRDVEDPDERFSIALQTIAETARENPHFGPLMLREVASGGVSLPEPVLLKMAGIFRIIAGILREGADRGTFREVNPLITHMIVAGGMIFMITASPIRARIREILGDDIPQQFIEPSPDELSAAVSDLVLHGIDLPKPNRPSRKKKRKES